MSPSSLHKPNTLKTLCAVAFAYLLLTLLFTHPLVLHLFDGLYGPPEDNLSRTWNFWWIKTALFNLKQSIYHTDYLFYPQGIKLYFNQFSFANALPAILLQFLVGPYAAYNLLVIFAFVMRGLGTFFLTDFCIRDRFGNTFRTKFAAFMAGFIYAFCPFFQHKSLHLLDIASAQYFPLMLLFIFKLADEPKIRYGLAAALFALLSAFCSWVYLVFLVPVSLFLAAYYAAVRPSLFQDRQRQWSLLLGVLLSVTCLLPFILPLFSEIGAGQTYMKLPIDNRHSLDLLAFFIPSDLHWSNAFLKDLFLRFYNHLPGDNWEINYFSGYSVLILAGMGAKALWRTKRFWPLWTGLFLLLSMGSTLRLGGADTGIPLPFFILSKIPLMDFSRVPGRYFTLAILGLSVLAAYGLAGLLERNGKRKIMALAFLLIGLEYFPVSADITPVRSPAVYDEIRKDTSCRAIVEIPLLGYYSNYKDAKYLESMGRPFRETHYVIVPNVHMFRQVYHGKKLFSGYVGRVYPEADSFYRHSSIKALVEMDTVALADSALRGDLTRSLSKLGVGYIMVHEDMLAKMFGSDCEARKNYLYSWLGAQAMPTLDKENHITAFKLNLREKDDGIPARD